MAKEVFQWIDPDGGTTTLNVQWDVDGRFFPKVEFRTDKIPGHAGEVMRSVRHGTRDVQLPVWFRATNETTVRDMLRDIIDKMDPARGVGKLRVTGPDGVSQRELSCYYASGLSMPEKRSETSTKRDQKAIITFTAFSPYWEDVSYTQFDFSPATAATFFPFFPITLTASEVYATQTVDNDGSVECWPLWTITGPGSVIRLSNMTTGEKIELSKNGGLTLGVGEQVIVDTSEGVKTVVNQAGTNLFKYLSNDSSLWSLARGSNSVQLEMSGANTAQGSKLSLRYKQRYNPA